MKTHALSETLFPPVADAAIVEALRGIVTPHLSDNLDRLCGITGLTRYNRHGKLVGTAFTIKTRPGDNLMIYKALTLIQPGHVLVVDGGGDLNNAVVGELIKLYAEQRGCAGLVIDGAIRDVLAFESSEFPCYARGVIHRGPYKSGPGALNVPVSIGGQVVNPGDLIVGDEDGLVCFPQVAAPELIALAHRLARREDDIKAEIATGKPEQFWLDTVLRTHGLAS